MINDERGLTLVELLATLTLISLVTGIIWTTISIASQFSIGETTSLKLQQEANYIIAELQRFHRTCSEYNLTITPEEISINECKINGNEELSGKVISTGYIYGAFINKPAPDLTPSELLAINEYEYYVEVKQRPLKNDIVFTYFAIEDPNNDKRFVNIPTTISRYKTK